MRRILLLAGLLYFLSSAVVHALPTADVPCDTGIPDPDGLNTFSASSLTGDPASDGSAIPSDFPALDSLTWMDRTLFLTVEVIDGPPGVIPRNIGSTAPNSVRVLQFSNTTNFLSASFTARMNSPAASYGYQNKNHAANLRSKLWGIGPEEKMR